MLFAARCSAAAASTVLRRGLVQPMAAARPRAAASSAVAPRGQAVRRMAGDGHSPAPHPSQPKQAFLFNEGPGPRKVEIWEPITSIVYWSTLFILVIGLSSAPETRIKVCAVRGFEIVGGGGGGRGSKQTHTCAPMGGHGELCRTGVVGGGGKEASQTRKLFSSFW